MAHRQNISLIESLAKFLENQESRNRGLSLLQSIIGVGTYLVVMRYVVHTVGLEGVGIWSMTVGFVSFIRLMDLSGASGLARMLGTRSEDPFEQAYYVDTMSLFILSLYGLLCAAGFLPLWYVLSDSVPPDQLPMAQVLLMWALFALPLNVLGLCQLSAIDGIGRADIRSAINILGFLVFGIVAISSIRQNGLLGLAYAQFAQFAITLVVARLVLVKNIEHIKFMPLLISLRAAKACLGYGVKLQFMSLPMAAFDPLTRVLVGRWAGLEVLGIYDLSYKLAGYLRTLIQAYLAPLVPLFASQWEHDREAARVRFKQINEPTLRIVSVAYGTLVLLSPVASLFFLSKLSTAFIFSTVILALAWGLTTLTLPTHLLARAAGLLRWSIAGQLILLAVGPAMVYWAVQQLGQIWVSVSVAAAIFTGHALAYFGETRVLKLSPIGFNENRLGTSTITTVGGFICLSFLFLTVSVAFLSSNSAP